VEDAVMEWGMGVKGAAGEEGSEGGGEDKKGQGVKGIFRLSLFSKQVVVTCFPSVEQQLHTIHIPLIP